MSLLVAQLVLRGFKHKTLVCNKIYKSSPNPSLKEECGVIHEHINIKGVVTNKRSRY
jgi:hypothetical protein